MIEIDQETIQQTAIAILDSAKDGDTSYEDVTNEIAGLDGENDFPKGDILLMQILPDIIKHYPEDTLVDDEDSWRWHWTAVTTGQYPLEKLPDHVRDLAKALYYNHPST